MAISNETGEVRIGAFEMRKFAEIIETAIRRECHPESEGCGALGAKNLTFRSAKGGAHGDCHAISRKPTRNTRLLWPRDLIADEGQYVTNDKA